MEYVHITIHAQVFNVKHGSRMIELGAKLAKEKQLQSIKQTAFP